MKKKKFGVLGLLFVFSSCSVDSKLPLKIGDTLSDNLCVFQDEIRSRFDYVDYVFFEYKKQNHIIHFDPMTNVVIDLHSYPTKKIVENDFKKINVGMSIYEVVELVGLPFDSQTSGLISMNFRITDSQNYHVIYFRQPIDASEVLAVSKVIL